MAPGWRVFLPNGRGHPERPLNSIFRRFRHWALKGVFEILFNALSGDPFRIRHDRRHDRPGPPTWRQR